MQTVKIHSHYYNHESSPDIMHKVETAKRNVDSSIQFLKNMIL